MKKRMKKRKNGKRLLAWILCLCLMGTLFPVTVRAGEPGSTGGFTVQGGAYGTDYEYANGVLTIKKDTKMTISTSSATNERIHIDSNVNANLIFKGVSLNCTDNSIDRDAVWLKENSTLKLELQDVNSLKSEYCSGIKMAAKTSLIFEKNSSGSLTATGGNGGSYRGGYPGISMDDTAVLTIEGGSVTAIGGHYNYSKSEYSIGEGIKGGTVHANGGYVNAKGALHYIDWTPIKAAGISGTFTAEGNAIVDTTHGIRDKSNQGNWKGIIFDDEEGQVYGDYTLDSDFTIPNGKTLTIPENTTLTIPEGKTLTVASESNLVINGTVDDSKGTLSVKSTGKITGAGSISNKIKPPVPVAVKQTSNSITLHASSDGGGAIEYRGAGDWQSDPIFTGLQPSQGYSFKVRFMNDQFYDGISEEVIYYTAYERPETGVGFSIDYEQETITVQDDYIVTTQNGSNGWWGSEVKSGESCYVQSYDNTLYIRKKGKDSIPESAPQSILIPARPSCDLSVDCAKEGVMIPAGYCYSTDYGTVKEHKVAEDTFVPLAPGAYVYACKPAVTEGENKAFASDPQSITAPQRAATPNVSINYVTEIFSTTTAMEYKIDDGQWTNCTSNMSAADFGWDNTKNINVTFRNKATKDKYASETQSLTIGVGEGAPAAGDGYTIDYINETITVDRDYEVNTKPDFTGDAVITGKINFNTSSNMVYYIRKKASNNTPASAATEVVIPCRSNAPAAGTFTVTQPAVSGGMGSIAGITDKMEYSPDEGKTWENGTGTAISIEDQTTVWIRYKAVVDIKFASGHYSVAICHEPKFCVAVTGGTGGGDYTAGESVTITANTAPEGKRFKNWTGLDGLTITKGSTRTESVTFTMPAKAVTVTANYESVSAGNSGSGGGGSTYTPPAQPQIKDDNGNTGWTTIEKKIEDTIKNQTEGDTKEPISIDMNGTTTIPKSVLDTVKGKDVTVVFDMGNGIAWTVNGKDVTGTSGDINLGVKTNTTNIPMDVLNKVTGERVSMQISLDHNGEFGFTATLTVNMEPKNKGLYANLFYFNPKAEKGSELEFICADEIDEKGNANLLFNHASDYTIVIDKEPMQVEKPDNPAEPEKPSDPTTPEVTAPKKGTMLTDSETRMVYKVTKSGKTGGMVQFVKTKNTKAKTVAVPDKVTIDGITYKVSSIATNALKNNKTVTTVTIGKYVTSIGSGAFSGCIKLKKVTIGKSVTTIGSKAFYNCTSLTGITIPSKVTKIGDYAFKGCSKLKKINLNTALLTAKTLSMDAFSGVSTKAVVKVPKKQLKIYKKLLVNRGLGKKVEIKNL